MEKKYSGIEDLIKENLKDDEDKTTSELIVELQEVKNKWYLTKDQFIKIGMWKSPRPRKLYLSNSENDIIDISKRALVSSSEIERIVYFAHLKWIKIPASSAILTLIDPQNYGVIDIRVRQVFYLYGLVEHNPEGIDFDPIDWINYLEKLRFYAKMFDTAVRNIERTLFLHHKIIQEGTLYG